MIRKSRPTSCPSRSCPTSHPTNPPPTKLIRHSLLKTRKGRVQRWRCKNCGSTFTQKTGTPYHRLRKTRAAFDRVIHMSLEGTSKASNARVNAIAPSTIARWIERAARAAERFQDQVLCEVEPHEIQADELRGYEAKRARRQFVFAALEVNARLWLSHRVGGRTKRNCRALMREARARCRQVPARTLIVTDPFKFYAEEIRRTWGPTCLHVESGKTIKGGRVIRVRNQLVLGHPWQLESAMRQNEDSKQPNTAFIERLNLFIRRSLASLHRRTNSAAHTHTALNQAVTLLRCYYNFVRPHGSLRFGRQLRTPAEQADITTRKLTWRDIFQSSRPNARVPSIRNPSMHEAWSSLWRCPASNS